MTKEFDFVSNKQGFDSLGIGTKNVTRGACCVLSGILKDFDYLSFDAAINDDTVVLKVIIPEDVDPVDIVNPSDIRSIASYADSLEVSINDENAVEVTIKIK